MEKYLSLLQNTTFFKSFDQPEMIKALNCLKGQVVSYDKGEVLLHSETVSQSIGIILEGTIYLSKTNIHGERQIFAELNAGELFSENCLWKKTRSIILRSKQLFPV